MMTDNARKQIKADSERDEAKARQTCFWDNLPGTVLVSGAWLCESHAMCSSCLKSLASVKAPVFCVCDDYDYSGHEELAWCSVDCMESAHPEAPERDPEEELA